MRWDLDGNGAPDLKPGVRTDEPGDDDYLSDPNPSISIIDVGHKVTLWYTDPVYGDTVSVTRKVDRDALSAGGGK